MLTIVAIFLILASTVYSGYMLRGAKGLLVVYFLLAATIAGVAIASLARTRKVEYNPNEATSGIEQVAALGQMREAIDGLARQEMQTQARIQESEKSLAEAQSSLRQAYRALFATVFFYSLTRDLVPTPANVQRQIGERLDEIAKFAYPDEKERADAIREIIKQTVAPARSPMPAPRSKLMGREQRNYESD